MEGAFDLYAFAKHNLMCVGAAFGTPRQSQSPSTIKWKTDALACLREVLWTLFLKFLWVGVDVKSVCIEHRKVFVTLLDPYALRIPHVQESNFFVNAASEI